MNVHVIEVFFKIIYRIMFVHLMVNENVLEKGIRRLESPKFTMTFIIFSSVRNSEHASSVKFR